MVLKATRDRARRGVALPWERRGAWVRELLAGRRWKVLLSIAVALSILFLVDLSTTRSLHHPDTNWPIFISGMRIENAIPPVTPPRTTMRSGSISDVIPWTLASTCVS